MPRQASVTQSSGTEWPRAAIDAPDAYYSQARACYVDGQVIVYDKQHNEIQVYALDSEPIIRSGKLIGMVDGRPFTMRPDCSCSKPYRRVAK